MRAGEVDGPDAVLFFPSQFGMGMMLHGSLTPMLGPTSFGHAGAGGSLGYADVDASRLRLRDEPDGRRIAGDPRTIALNDAVRACL